MPCGYQEAQKGLYEVDRCEVRAEKVASSIFLTMTSQLSSPRSLRRGRWGGRGSKLSSTFKLYAREI